MKERTGFAFICLLLVTCINQQSIAQATLGAREVGLGQATTALPESGWSVFANPAMIDRNSNSVSFFGLRYYGLAEITDMAAAVNITTSVGSIGFGTHRFGDDLFSESRLRVVYKNAYDGFHYGIALTYSHVAFGGDYGSVGAPGLDLGLAAMLTQALWIGAKATNVNQPSYGSYQDLEEELTRELSIGFSYCFSEIALFSWDVYKDVRFPISYRAGIEVLLFEYFSGRAGITTNPVTFSGGFGYANSLWGVNLVVQQHENPVLGLSPGIDLRVTW